MIAMEWAWLVVQAVAVAAAMWLVITLAWELHARRAARRSPGRSEPEPHDDEQWTVPRAA
jgi:hypothetical protein